jgi:hypothetical protein
MSKKTKEELIVRIVNPEALSKASTNLTIAIAQIINKQNEVLLG